MTDNNNNSPAWPMAKHPEHSNHVERYNQKYGDDPNHAWDDPEYRLRINGVEFSKLYDYCTANKLSTQGDIYGTVINDLKSKGKL